MIAYTIRRLLVSIPVLLLSSLMVFLMVTWGQDPLTDFKHKNPPPSLPSIKAREHLLGLDAPLWKRYPTWLGHALQGNFGASVRGDDVTAMLIRSIGTTAKLVVMAILVALVLGVAVGVLSAVRQYSAFDYSATAVSFLFFSLPVFWFAILLKDFAVKINDATGSHFFWTIGERTEGLQGGMWTHFYDWAGHIILPTITLALVSYASWSRFQRSSMLDVLNSDYMRLARAKGLSGRRVMLRHGLRTALIPLVTQVALDIPGFLSGVIITETIFNWRGLGHMLIDGITTYDANTTLAWLMFSASTIIVFNLLADLLYAVLDPRIRLA
jgi:peptide/nickel transport system permease protein